MKRFPFSPDVLVVGVLAIAVVIGVFWREIQGAVSDFRAAATAEPRLQPPRPPVPPNSVPRPRRAPRQQDRFVIEVPEEQEQGEWVIEEEPAYDGGGGYGYHWNTPRCR